MPEKVGQHRSTEDFITLHQDSGDYTYATILESGLTEKQAFEREAAVISFDIPSDNIKNIKSKITAKATRSVYRTPIHL